VFTLIAASFFVPATHSNEISQADQYGPRPDELDVLFYPTQEASFNAMVNNDTYMLNTAVTSSQAQYVVGQPYIQQGGFFHGYYQVPRNTWAILIAGGWAQSSNKARYWNDLGETYTMLKAKGYTDNETFVLYANGNAPSSANCYDPSNVYAQYNNMVIDYSATKANLKKACDYISAKSGDYDTLYVFTTDHGSSGAGTPLNLWGETISSGDFAGTSYVGNTSMKYSLRVVAMEQCYSGGFIASLASSKSVITTATCSTNQSWSTDNVDKSGNTINEGYYDEYCYYWTAALRSQDAHGNAVDADTDDNGWVSLTEAFNYASSKDSQQEPHTDGADDPQWSDQGNHGNSALPSGHYALVPKSDDVYGVHYMMAPAQEEGPDNYWTFLKVGTATGPLKYGLASIPVALNVITSTDKADWDCLNRIYDKLLGFSPYDQSLKTGLRPRMAWNWQLDTWTKPVSFDLLGYGDGTLREFYMHSAPIVPGSETVFMNGIPQQRYVQYIPDYGMGLITFIVPPPVAVEIVATYVAPCTKVTFSLRNNIAWHDGVSCTAEDVAFAIDYVKNLGEMAHNYPLVKNVHHTELVDPYTVSVYEDILNEWALWWIGSLPIIPRHLFQSILDPSGYTPGNLPPEIILKGCGPWMFAVLNPTLELILVANRGYYLKTPPLGEIDFYMEVNYSPTNPTNGYKVNIYDIVMICVAYGSKGYGIPDENFDSGCDITTSGHNCTINIYDVVLACSEYGTTWGTTGIP
jgi:hypothetical protein